MAVKLLLLFVVIIICGSARFTIQDDPHTSCSMNIFYKMQIPQLLHGELVNNGFTDPRVWNEISRTELESFGFKRGHIINFKNYLKTKEFKDIIHTRDNINNNKNNMTFIEVSSGTLSFRSIIVTAFFVFLFELLISFIINIQYSPNNSTNYNLDDYTRNDDDIKAGDTMDTNELVEDTRNQMNDDPNGMPYVYDSPRKNKSIVSKDNEPLTNKHKQQNDINNQATSIDLKENDDDVSNDMEEEEKDVIFISNTTQSPTDSNSKKSGRQFFGTLGSLKEEGSGSEDSRLYLLSPRKIYSNVNVQLPLSPTTSVGSDPPSFNFTASIISEPTDNNSKPTCTSPPIKATKPISSTISAENDRTIASSLIKATKPISSTISAENDRTIPSSLYVATAATTKTTKPSAATLYQQRNIRGVFLQSFNINKPKIILIVLITLLFSWMVQYMMQDNYKVNYILQNGMNKLINQSSSLFLERIHELELTNKQILSEKDKLGVQYSLLQAAYDKLLNDKEELTNERENSLSKYNNLEVIISEYKEYMNENVNRELILLKNIFFNYVIDSRLWERFELENINDRIENIYQHFKSSGIENISGDLQLDITEQEEYLNKIRGEISLQLSELISDLEFKYNQKTKPWRDENLNLKLELNNLKTEIRDLKRENDIYNKSKTEFETKYNILKNEIDKIINQSSKTHLDRINKLQLINKQILSEKDKLGSELKKNKREFKEKYSLLDGKYKNLLNLLFNKQELISERENLLSKCNNLERIISENKEYMNENLNSELQILKKEKELLENRYDLLYSENNKLNDEYRILFELIQELIEENNNEELIKLRKQLNYVFDDKQPFETNQHLERLLKYNGTDEDYYTFNTFTEMRAHRLRLTLKQVEEGGK